MAGSYQGHGLLGHPRDQQYNYLSRHFFIYLNNQKKRENGGGGGRVRERERETTSPSQPSLVLLCGRPVGLVSKWKDQHLVRIVRRDHDGAGVGVDNDTVQGSVGHRGREQQLARRVATLCVVRQRKGAGGPEKGESALE